MQNRGASFSLEGGALNALEPGRLPPHTLNPALAVLADGRIIGYGAMGGDGQPQTQAAIFTRHVRYRAPLMCAIDAPRWLLGRTWGATHVNLRMEARFDGALVDQLLSAGHDVEMLAEPYSDVMGHAGAVVLHPDGTCEGGHDPRADGGAAGRRFGVTFSCRRKAISRLHSAAVRDIVPLRARGVCEARTGALASKSMIHRLFSYALAAFAGLVIAPAAAQAHPHIWVTVKSEVVYGPDGTVTGVRHAWTFDDMFSVFATQGIESKKKGEFTREELAPLAEVNVTSLKEYDFFTYAKANGKKVEFNDPLADYYLDFNPKDTVLTLYFTLPLKAPVKAKDLTLEVYDREFFVDFSFAEKDPVKLVGAPAHCKLSIGRPQEMGAALSQQLSQLGADQRDPSLTIGSEFANKIAVKCP
jgi:ABC-type uncharacterized transport system substrate-binding protein